MTCRCGCKRWVSQLSGHRRWYFSPECRYKAKKARLRRRYHASLPHRLKKRRWERTYYRRPVTVERVHRAASTPQSQEINWRRRAWRLIDLAKKAGLLPSLDGRVRCTDCERPAMVYDHRDYTNPLKVDPVCITCNIRRGKGLNPGSSHRKYRKTARPAFA